MNTDNIARGFYKQAAMSEMEKEAILKMLSPSLRKKITAGVGAATMLASPAAKAGEVSKKLMDNKTTITKAVKGTGGYKSLKGGLKNVERKVVDSGKKMLGGAKETVFNTKGKAMISPGSASEGGITKNVLNLTNKAKDGVELTGKSSPVKTKLSLNKLRLQKGDLQATVRKSGLSAKYKNISGKLSRGGNVNVAYQATPNINVSGFTGPGGSGASVGGNWSF